LHIAVVSEAYPYSAGLSRSISASLPRNSAKRKSLSMHIMGCCLARMGKCSARI